MVYIRLTTLIASIVTLSPCFVLWVIDCWCPKVACTQYKNVHIAKGWRVYRNCLTHAYEMWRGKVVYSSFEVRSTSLIEHVLIEIHNAIWSYGGDCRWLFFSTMFWIQVYLDGTTTMSTHERKASLREFYSNSHYLKHPTFDFCPQLCQISKLPCKTKCTWSKMLLRRLILACVTMWLNTMILLGLALCGNNYNEARVEYKMFFNSSIKCSIYQYASPPYVNYPFP